MKIFNTEKEKNKIHIQTNDIIFLNTININLPNTITKKMISELKLSVNENKLDFVEFSSKKEIEFFKNIECIIDYDEYINLSDEELEEKAQQIYAEIIIIKDKTKDEYKMKKHMLENLVEIYRLKKGLSTIKLSDFSAKIYRR